MAAPGLHHRRALMHLHQLLLILTFGRTGPSANATTEAELRCTHKAQPERMIRYETLRERRAGSRKKPLEILTKTRDEQHIKDFTEREPKANKNQRECVSECVKVKIAAGHDGSFFFRLNAFSENDRHNKRSALEAFDTI